MHLRYLLLTASALCFLSPAFAQETAPGDACTLGETNYIKQVGGPETSGNVHLMRCDGVNWQQYITFSENGNVGIGSASPNSLFYLQSTSGTELTIARNDNTVSTGNLIGGVKFSANDNGGSQVSGIKSYAVAPNGNQRLSFYAGGVAYIADSPHLTIDEIGYIGIGTGNPNSWLHVVVPTTTGFDDGGVIIDGQAGSSDAVLKVRAAANPSAVADSDTAFVVKGSGNVGIGTLIPQSELHVVVNTTTGFNDTGLYVDGQSGSSEHVFKVRAGPNPEAVTDVDTKFIVRGDGRVGIGTTSPAATIDVNGFARLATNSAAPATCAAGTAGSIALTSTHRMCVCDGASWNEVNSAIACTW